MITEYVDEPLDRFQRDPVQQPAYRLLLYSRWLDSDSDIVNGNTTQAPIDITGCVQNATLNLSSDTDASTLATTVLLSERVPVDLFFNCVIRLFEGDARVDAESWAPTFWGYHVGQPQATEANRQEGTNEDNSFTRRGTARSVSVTFVSRARVYANQEITSPGLWIPKGTAKNQDPELSYRDAYDDLGSIAREIAQAPWGMGLAGGEVSISNQPYRIEKQLQIVSTNVLEALNTILQPVRLVPYFTGRGTLSTYSRDVNKPAVRSYNRADVTEMPQQGRSQRLTNAVKVTGLDSELTEIIHADQVLERIQGTFGFFDSEMEFSGRWGGEETDSYRVKLGTVTDGKGVTVTSPRIDGFQQDGFIITPVATPTFVNVSEFDYEVEITNDVALVVAAIAILLGGYTAAAIITTAAAPITTVPGAPTVPNPFAVAGELASSALLIAGLAVLRQIGNFEFQIRGVPFETVYRELTSTANLSQFGSFDQAGATAIRDYERVEESVENHILSSQDDRTTDDGTVNIGLQRWAEKELAWQHAKGASRIVRIPRDILLEPGDAIEFGGQVVFIESISRTLRRGDSEPQTISGFQIRKA